MSPPLNQVVSSVQSYRSMVSPRRFLIALASLTVFCSSVFSVSVSGSSSALTTGIEGSVSVGPMQGGPAIKGVPDSAPLANMSFVVEQAAGVVANFTTDDQGRFRVPLPPGRYTVRSANMKTKNAKCKFEVEVDATGFKKIHYKCDTGMR